MSDIVFLWTRREVAPILTARWLRLWARRIVSLPGLAGILWRRQRLRIGGAKIGALSVVSWAEIGGSAKLLAIGKCTFVGRAHVALHSTVTIGDCCVVSDFATFLTGSHAINDPDWSLVARPIQVGDYAWVGQGATVLPGVSNGRGAVVGAGAVVTSDVEAYAVVAGNPARAVGEKRIQEFRYCPTARVAPFAAWLGSREIDWVGALDLRRGHESPQSAAATDGSGAKV